MLCVYILLRTHGYLHLKKCVVSSTFSIEEKYSGKFQPDTPRTNNLKYFTFLMDKLYPKQNTFSDSATDEENTMSTEQPGEEESLALGARSRLRCEGEQRGCIDHCVSLRFIIEICLRTGH